MFGRRKNRRRRPFRERLRDWCDSGIECLRIAAPWALLGAVAVVVPLLVYAGYHQLLSSPYFRVSHIEIEGDPHAEIRRLAEEAGVVHGVNILRFDAEGAAERLESSSWIREASIVREYPDGLAVEIRERRPGGILVDGKFYVVDRKGRRIERVQTPEEAGFSSLPLVTGLSVEELEEERGRQWVREGLRVASLYDRMGLSEHRSLSEVHIDPVLGLTLVTEGTATEVRLGRGEYRRRLERLKTVRRRLEERGIEPSYLLLDGDSFDRVTVGRRRSQGSASGAAQ